MTVGRTRLLLDFACGDPGCHLVVVIGDVILGNVVGRGIPHAVMAENGRCIIGVDHVFNRQELRWFILQRIHTCDTPSTLP
jgi:hypothetical protein